MEMLGTARGASGRLSTDPVIAAVRACNLAHILPVLGHEVGRNGFLIEHPWRVESESSIHVNDRNPSRWHDFGADDPSKCGGDLIDFIQHSTGVGFREAKAEAARLLGIDARMVSTPRDLQRRSIPRKPVMAATPVDLAPFVRRAQAALEHPSGAHSLAAHAFLSDRGIAPGGDIARRLRLGVIDASALRASRGTADGPYLGRIVFPYLDRDGVPQGFNARTVDSARRPRYLKARGVRQALPYNISSVRAHAPVIVVEGELDALAIATSMGTGAAVIATGGGHLAASHAAQLAGVSAAYLLFDNDAAGAAMAQRARRLLSEWDISSVPLTLPHSLKDPADFLSRHGSEDLRTWMLSRGVRT